MAASFDSIGYSGSRQPARPGGLRAFAESQRRLLAFVLSLAGYLLILISLRPYGVRSDGVNEEATGDIVNQIGFLAAAAIVVAALGLLADRRVLAKLLSPAWLATLVVLAISVMITADPNETMRSALFAVFAIVVAIGATVLPFSQTDFRNAMAAAALVTIAFAYLSVLVVPDLAIHSASGAEAIHAGLWRGHYVHKNVAGPVMSILAMFGVYAWRTGARIRGALIVVLAVFFVVMSGSKTTLGFLPLAIGVVLLRPLLGSATLVILAFAAGLALAFLFTIGSVLFEPIGQLLGMLPGGDPSFTGRTDIWRFALDTMADQPALGHGFYNFWGTEFVRGQDENFEAAWDVRGIGNAHSNYIDMPLMFGFAGAAIIFWATLFAPMADYVRAVRFTENHRLADFFMMVIVFTALTSLMESFFFNRADPVWLLLVIAIFGLRLLARTRLR